MPQVYTKMENAHLNGRVSRKRFINARMAKLMKKRQRVYGLKIRGDKGGKLGGIVADGKQNQVTLSSFSIIAFWMWSLFSA